MFNVQSVLATLLFLPLVAVAQEQADEVAQESQLTQEEQQQVEQLIQQFTQQKPETMDQQLPKYHAKTNKPLSDQKRSANKLKLSPEQQAQAQDPLQQQAQKKGTDEFIQRYCEKVLKKKFPKLKCDDALKAGKSTVEGNDELSDLTATWIDADDLKYNLGQIPVSGKTNIPIWSDDYWRLQFGATSYRYGDGLGEPANYKEAMKRYSQPADFGKLSAGLSVEELGKSAEFLAYSPAEKLDITNGDDNFTLTNEQKSEAAQNVVNGDVEAWMGICHGWAPAAFMLPKATKSVTVSGLNDVKVTWYPSDIRAMGSLAWANGSTETNFIGGRCNAKKVDKYKNGRLKQQDCFDNNPASFHLALGNMVGIKKYSFVIDKTFDYEVWNQPVHSYTFQYFNPLDTGKKCGKADWKKCAVAYDADFKAQDRFQGKGGETSTRGKRSGEKFNDKGVKKIVGVIATVAYGSEVTPNFGNDASEDALLRFTSTYDLEIDENDEVTGGEWHNNNHVDFMWVPTKGAVAKTSYDEVALNYKGKLNAKVENQGPKAASEGSPLCQVLAYLLTKSSGKSYSCDE